MGLAAVAGASRGVSSQYIRSRAGGPDGAGVAGPIWSVSMMTLPKGNKTGFTLGGSDGKETVKDRSLRGQSIRPVF